MPDQEKTIGLARFFIPAVTPAKARVQKRSKNLDSGFRRNDDPRLWDEPLLHFTD